MIPKGTFVRVKQVVYTTQERLSSIPKPTKETPLVLWCKGILQHDAQMMDEVEIRTSSGRLQKGFLETIQPSYQHTFGLDLEELRQIRHQIEEVLPRGEHHE